MKVKIELLSGTIFGSGKSVPGGENITVQADEEGFPYLLASTFKGILREEMVNLKDWLPKRYSLFDIKELFGAEGEHCIDDKRIIISDFTVSENVKMYVRKSKLISEQITECFTSTYTFTSINDDGIAKAGSLRQCRYINKGIVFYGNIKCSEDVCDFVKDGLSAIKFIGTMKSRGFGRVRVSEVIEKGEWSYENNKIHTDKFRAY